MDISSLQFPMFGGPHSGEKLTSGASRYAIAKENYEVDD